MVVGADKIDDSPALATRLCQLSWLGQCVGSRCIKLPTANPRSRGIGGAWICAHTEISKLSLKIHPPSTP